MKLLVGTIVDCCRDQRRKPSTSRILPLLLPKSPYQYLTSSSLLGRNRAHADRPFLQLTGKADAGLGCLQRTTFTLSCHDGAAVTLQAIPVGMKPSQLQPALQLVCEVVRCDGNRFSRDGGALLYFQVEFHTAESYLGTRLAPVGVFAKPWESGNLLLEQTIAGYSKAAYVVIVGNFGTVACYVAFPKSRMPATYGPAVVRRGQRLSNLVSADRSATAGNVHLQAPVCAEPMKPSTYLEHQ